eukprot:1138439_1
MPTISQIPSAIPSELPTQPQPTDFPSMLPTLEFSTEPSVEFSVEPSLAITKDPTAAPIVITEEPTLSAAPSISFQPTLEQIYRYDLGACPDRGETGLACADPSIRNI